LLWHLVSSCFSKRSLTYFVHLRVGWTATHFHAVVEQNNNKYTKNKLYQMQFPGNTKTSAVVEVTSEQKFVEFCIVIFLMRSD